MDQSPGFQNALFLNPILEGNEKTRKAIKENHTQSPVVNLQGLLKGEAQAKAQTDPDFERTLAKGSLCCVFRFSGFLQV